MIKGQKKRELTADNILSKISEMIIYRYYFGSFELNEATYNHLRGEDRNGTPSFIISNRYGHLHHVDFSSGKDWSGDCFQLVQQIYGCSYNEALKIIDKDLGLGILPENNSGIYRKLKKELKVPDETSKRYSLIQVVTRKFTKEELGYWKQYNISEQELKDNHVYSIKEMFLNKRRHPLCDLRFGYLYDGYWKIYCPYENKKKKWISNVPITTLDGKQNIENCCTAWITKSKKDLITLKKFYPYVISTQNESISCFSEENIKFIKDNSKKQIVLYDSDEAGKKASLEVTKKFGFGYCNVPNKYLEEGITDFSDLYRVHGEQVVRDYLISKKVLDE